ncbi:YecA family protein [Bradyrhizobium liaoningense]|nr:YecA family protein [Bradyrhizobium liaoningense]
MTSATMPLTELERWLQARANRHPVATSIPMLDGYAAAISAVALRHNDISNTLSTAPDRFEPIHRRDVNGDIDPRPWCQGFYAAMQLRLSAWAPLLDAANVTHGLLLPILLHSRDDQSRPLLGAPQSGRETRNFLPNAHADIPAAVEALRQYWMPIRYAR